VRAFEHGGMWRNRLVLGDGLAAMAALQAEGLAGRVQMVYFDPPYGIAFDARARDGGGPAYRDAWARGTASYLAWLHERLALARGLLAPTGSLFLQIGDEHAHLARALLDEVFGARSFASHIVFHKTAGKAAAGLDSVVDHLLWYARDRAAMTYRELYRERPAHTLEEQYTWLELAGGRVRRLTREELAGKALPRGARRFMAGDLSSQDENATGCQRFALHGKEYRVPAGRHWPPEPAMRRLRELGRLFGVGDTLRYKRYACDFPLATFTNAWDDTVVSGFAPRKRYAVQTSPKVVERCLLMATEPGDLVLDPACGSGTVPWCAEAWGRRWVACDTSRLAVHLTRLRLLGGTFPAQRLRGAAPAGGFTYARVPKVTLKGLAYGLPAVEVERRDQPQLERGAVRVAGAFEVAVVPPRARGHEAALCRRYAPGAPLRRGGLVRAVAEAPSGRFGVAVGPPAGAVTPGFVRRAASEARALGLGALHVLGWGFAPNVGDALPAAPEVGLLAVRPDALAQHLAPPAPGALAAPLPLPEVEVAAKGDEALVTLRGVRRFDAARGLTLRERPAGGSVAAWLLDEDHDGARFVVRQAIFAFPRRPRLAGLGARLPDEAFAFRSASAPFAAGPHRRVAVKVVDAAGTEATVVRAL
jgi:adenine-specific DNA-methyltransferase